MAFKSIRQRDITELALRFIKTKPRLRLSDPRLWRSQAWQTSDGISYGNDTASVMRDA